MTSPIEPRDDARSFKSLSPKRGRLAALMIGASALAIVAAANVPAGAQGTAPVVQVADSAVPAGGPDFAALAEKAKPAVVSIKVKKVQDASAKDDDDDEGPSNRDPFNGENPFKGTPFEHFFDRFGQNRGDGNGEGKSEPKGFAWAAGSGFFISPDGYVVTNNHVVEGAVNVDVVMENGNTLPAKVIGTDPKTDLALVKVEGKSDFPFVKLAANKPRIGDWVMAVGNPFGLGGTVTSGIVSAQGRDIGSGPYDDYLQIDAPINKGNSGGPTFNLAGDVVGVNTAIYSPSGGSVGIAFDIPASTVAQVIPVLKDKGHIERGWLGVQVQDVTADVADSVGLSKATGALISEPMADSPAEKAGLRSGDIITKIDGEAILNGHDLARKIGAMKPDSSILLTRWRDGAEKDIRMTLDVMKDKPTQVATNTSEKGDGVGSLGLTVAPARQVPGSGAKGLIILSVDPSGAAASQGLQAGDVLLSVGEKELASAKDLKEALTAAAKSGKKHALALVQHGKDRRYVPLSAA